MNNENPEMKPVGGTNDGPQMISSEAILTGTTPETSAPVETSTPQEPTAEILVPNDMKIEETTTPKTSAPTTLPATRYNAVTGEEISTKELLGQKDEPKPEEDAVNNEEKLKTVEVDYKPTSTANTVMLVIFFIALIAFVIFLPDIQTLIAAYKEGPVEVEDIATGKLVCTLESSTVNLDRNITRTFEYTEKKLQNAKFTTVVRGDATLDEDALDELNAQCEQIKSNVEGLDGVSVNCTYENGKLTEKESFDYATYKIEDVTAAYAEAGGNVLEFAYEQDIDSVMTNMRQGGFTCNKEK